MTGDKIQFFRQEAVRLLGATALAVPLITGSAQANPSDLRADAPDTIPYKILKHEIDPKTGHTSLTVDASAIEGKKWEIFTDQITKAAILMPGINGDRLCPFINLKQYAPRIEQVEKGLLHFIFRAQVSPGDAQKTLSANCLIINIPSVRDITWKQKPF